MAYRVVKHLLYSNPAPSSFHQAMEREENKVNALAAWGSDELDGSLRWLIELQGLLFDMNI